MSLIERERDKYYVEKWDERETLFRRGSGREEYYSEERGEKEI